MKDKRNSRYQRIDENQARFLLHTERPDISMSLPKYREKILLKRTTEKEVWLCFSDGFYIWRVFL